MFPGTPLVRIRFFQSLCGSYAVETHMDRLDRPNFAFFPGYLSWRNTTEGSWFVQALCKELQDKGTSDDIHTIVTCVKRRVAIDYESNTGNNRTNKKKQMPCVTDTLTRRLIFTRR
jgi:hypothetical protein